MAFLVTAAGVLTILDPVSGAWSGARSAEWGNRTVTLPGLVSPVTVVRDGAGTIHLYAQDDTDLFFAQGYTQASDRLFQMEIESLAAQGNLSSWVGPSAVGSDLSFRYLGIPRAAAEMANLLPTVNRSAATDIEAYSAGVNAYIASAETSHTLPLGFALLGVRPYSWSPFATFAFERLMVLSQTAGVTEPMYAAVAAATLGDAAVNELFPIYPHYYEGFTVLPGNGSINGVSLGSMGVNASYLFSLDWLGAWATGVPTSEESGLLPLYRAAIDNLSDPYLPGLGAHGLSEEVGSNSWAVAANRTDLGVPLLANDPHLPLSLPSLWVPTELVDPSYDVAGWSLAGTPGILIGHDATFAWGLTYSGGATALDYVETLEGGSYLDNGSWHALSWTNGSIPVRGGAPVPFDLAWTNNGPIVARIGDAGISVRWAGEGPTWELLAELGLDHASSIAEAFGTLARYWAIPSLNFMMAEEQPATHAGHIGWVIPTRYPLLPARLPDGESVEVIGSEAPLNGSGGFEPNGTVPFDLAPHVVDPAQGYLYAPNQPTVGPEYPYPFIGSWWDSGGRARTIGTFLSDHPLMTVPLMEALQANVTDAWASLGTPLLADSLGTLATSPLPEAPLAGLASAAVDAWNGSFGTSEVGATIYSYWWNSLVNVSVAPLAARVGLPGLPDPSPDALFWTATHDPSGSLFPHGWTNASSAAVVLALDLLSRSLPCGGTATLPHPSSIACWEWGTVHPFTLRSLLGLGALDEGPYPEGGDGYTVSVAPFSSALVVPLEEGVVGSSLRMVTVPSATPSIGVIPGGLSENPASAYYANELGLWLSHAYVSMSLVPGPHGPFVEGVVSTWSLRP